MSRKGERKKKKRGGVSYRDAYVHMSGVISCVMHAQIHSLSMLECDSLMTVGGL